METKNIIQIVVAAFLAVVLILTIVASAICLPHTDRDIHGSYRITESNWREKR